MNLLEEAAKRLKQLEAAGVAVKPHAEPTGATVRFEPAEPKKRPAEANRAPVCKLDRGRLQAGGFITPTLQDSKLLHEFRVIKRPLIQHALGKTATQAL